MESNDFTNVIACGTLFEEKLMGNYYKLYNNELSKLQAQALDYVCNHPGSMAKDIAVTLDIPKQYASKIVRKLIEQDFIQSNPSEKDGRVQLLFPTESGLRNLNAHVALSVQNFSEKLAILTPEECEQLLTSFSILKSLLEKL